MHQRLFNIRYPAGYKFNNFKLVTRNSTFYSSRIFLDLGSCEGMLLDILSLIADFSPSLLLTSLKVLNYWVSTLFLQFPTTRFFHKQRFFSTQPQCCSTFLWIELQMLLRCCLIHISIIILRHFLYLLYLCPWLDIGLFVVSM